MQDALVPDQVKDGLQASKYFFAVALHAQTMFMYFSSANVWKFPLATKWQTTGTPGATLPSSRSPDSIVGWGRGSAGGGSGG